MEHGGARALCEEGEDSVIATLQVEIEVLGCKGVDMWAYGVMANVIGAGTAKATMAVLLLEPSGSTPPVERSPDTGSGNLRFLLCVDFLNVLDEPVGVTIMLLIRVVPMFDFASNWPVAGFVGGVMDGLKCGALETFTLLVSLVCGPWGGAACCFAPDGGDAAVVACV